MKDFTDEERRQVLEEALMDEFKVIREYLSEITDIKIRLVRVEDKVDKISDDMDVIKSVAKSHSKKLNNHELRIGVLERSA